MYALIFLISSLHVAAPFSYSAISDESVLRVLFGNVSEMRDLFLPPLDEISSSEESSLEEEDEVPDLRRFLKETSVDLYPPDEIYNQTIYNHDITEFNTISKLLNNIDFEPAKKIARQNETRRQNQAWDYQDAKDIEMSKHGTLKGIMLSLVIHVRFKVDMAVRQRQRSRHTKGYRLGYLFSRLRRLKYNVAKAIHDLFRAHYERHIIRNYYFRIINHHTDLALRWYEKVVRLDVEIRDIIDLVIEVHNEVIPYSTTVSDYYNK